MFGLAAVRHERQGDSRLSKFEPQSVTMIAVGHFPNSNGLQFYNPANGTFTFSIDYKFQNHATTGAYFNLKYQPGVFIYRLDESTSIYAPQFTLESQVYVHTHSPPSIATVIGISTCTSPNIYTVVFKDGSISEYTTDLLSAASTSVASVSSSLLPSWIKGGAPAILFLDGTTKPIHGKLDLSSENEWYFYPGKSTVGILLSDLSANYQQLMDSGQQFKGHSKFKNVSDTRTQLGLRDCVLRHVAAHGLHSLVPPTSLKAHNKLDPHDCAIWDAAYDEEYDELDSLPTWEVISESQYRQLSKGRQVLPTMAIATIKYDENNRPKREKYRLVVLGNLDYHTWSKESTAAPVMSQLELRLLTSLAVYNRRVLKNYDVKQAFIQSSLPADEEYFLRPLPGCPQSKLGQYWHLLRSLYGLKRAPKLWFEMLSSHLKAMGLKCSETSSWLFYGVLVPGEPPVYIGIYVDDIIYFSASDITERMFEEKLATIGSVDFMGQVSWFIGTEFFWVFHDGGHLSVSLTQQSFAETLIDSLGLDFCGQSSFTTPYQTGQSIDSLPAVPMSSSDRNVLRLKYQSLVGSLNWLAHTTHPDLATVVSLLAQHQSDPLPGHYDAACYVVKYLATMKTLGIYFTSHKRSLLESFLHFPVPSQVLSMSDANWGPQDACLPTVSQEPPLFASRSMSAFSIDLLGPLLVLLSQKYMPQMNASSFYWSWYKSWNFLRFVTFSCLQLISYIMIIKLVCNGQNKLPLRGFVTYRCEKITFEKTLLPILSPFIILMGKSISQTFLPKR